MAKVRRQKMQNLRIVKKYLEHLENHITQHDLLNKTQTISKELTREQDLTDNIWIRLDNINNLQIQGMLSRAAVLKAAHKTIWLDAIDHAPHPDHQILEILVEVSKRTTIPCLDFVLLKASSSNPQLGKHDTRRDPQPIDTVQNPTLTTTRQPKSQAKMARRTSWGPSQSMGNHTKKWMKQLIWTEEQCNHVQQIKQANHALWGGGGLAKVTTMNERGDKEHHYSKDNIKRECLEEARARFTQANDTPFLSKPLFLELGLMGMMSKQFDQITQGTYEPPQTWPTMCINWSYYWRGHQWSKTTHYE